MRCYAGDFETTTDEDDCRVWAYSLCNIGDYHEFKYGNNIEDFFEDDSDDKYEYTYDMLEAIYDYIIYKKIQLEAGSTVSG